MGLELYPLHVVAICALILTCSSLRRYLPTTAHDSTHDTRNDPHNTRPSLDHLPVELLEDIFRLACTDGGPTGCALALVSKRVHTVSRSARFTSLSLLSGSHRRLQRLLDALHAARAAARRSGAASPRVRHLCLALAPVSPASFAPDRSPAHHAFPSEFEQHLFNQSCDERDWLERSLDAARSYQTAARALLQSAAGDLETLCLFARIDATSAAMDGLQDVLAHAFPSGPFPQLRELSLSGEGPALALPPSADAVDRRARRPPLFPSITRLHFALDGAGSVDFERWVQEAPNLSLLRVTADNCMGFTKWMVNLREVVDGFDTKSDQSVPTVMVLLKPNPVLKALNFLETYHLAVSGLYKSLQDKTSPIVFVPYYAYQDVERRLVQRFHHVDELLRKDWLSRTAGSGEISDHFWRDFRDTSSHFFARIRATWTRTGYNWSLWFVT